MSDEQRPDDATDTDDTRPDAETVEPSDDADSFPRSYVERLRKESAGYRDKAKTADTRSDELARQLFTARVAATGHLADPSDLPYDPEWLDDETEMLGAIAALLDEKPHLKARKVTGDVGQGRRDTAESVDLAAMLRARA
jgi:hypothetical protein